MAAEKNEEITAISLTISGEKLDFGQDPSEIQATAISRQGKAAEKEEEKQQQEEEHEGKSNEVEIFRESKRRKACVTALEKFSEDPSSPSSIRGFSFSFDTKIASIESTPKFGSFNLVPDLGFGASTAEDCDGVSLGLGLGLGFWDKEKSAKEEEKVVGSRLDGDERGI